MKILATALSIAIVAISTIVAVLAYNNTKYNLSLRTRQVEQMITNHLKTVTLDHKRMIETDDEIVRILKNQDAILRRIAVSEHKLRDVSETNRKILQSLETASISQQVQSPRGP